MPARAGKMPALPTRLVMWSEAETIAHYFGRHMNQKTEKHDL